MTKADTTRLTQALNRINATTEQRFHALILLADSGLDAAMRHLEVLTVAGEIGDVYEVASVVMGDAELTF